MKKTFLKDETFWTVTLGILGCFALFWTLLNNPSEWPDIIVNFAQIGVAVIVFFIANNIFKDLMKKKAYGFNDKFEQYLLEWVDQNKYLVDATNINEEKGKDGKRTIDMIVNHENFVTGSLLASEVSGPKNKGAFLYLPLNKDLKTNQTMQFKINKGMFGRRSDINYDNEKNSILEKIANRINFEFSSIGVRARKSSEPEKIDVDFSNLEKTDENAKKLIDVVEFVKTIFLAIS